MLTPERRAELREYAAGIVGVEQTSMLALLDPADLLDLLDAADERDRLAAVLARAQGAFPCCSHCEGDAIAHEVPCTLCQSSIGEVERLRAERDRLTAAIERDRLAGNRREPRDLDWDRSVDNYRAVGWDGEPGDYERMFFESGWRAAIRALDGTDD